MINVTDYGAVANWINDASPGTNNESAFEAAIDAANVVGDEIYFPPGNYWLDKPIYKTDLNNLRFYGTGAVIICRGSDSVPNQNGAGGGFTLEGAYLTIDGLTFQGWAEAIGVPGPYNYGRLVQLTGNYNRVKNCNFHDGNGGAVQLTGNYNIISHNFFEKCNNYPVAHADYGAIQVVGSSEYNTISENKIVDQFYSGVCAYGNEVQYLDILNNYIRSNSSDITIDHSMGLYFLEGANRNLKIIGNTIEKVDAEGIVIQSIESAPAATCMISNNIIRDFDYVAISLECANNNSGATFTDFTITDNLIKSTSAAAKYAYHIWLDRVADSLVANNKCIGYNKMGTSIGMNNSCPRNQISDNQIKEMENGISFYSPDGTLKDNHIYNCTTGLTLAYCYGASILGNFIKTCDTGITYGVNSSPLHIVNNSIVNCTKNYSGTVAPEVLTFSGVAGDGAYSSFVNTGSLSSGNASVTFYNVFDGDRFLVLPANQAGNGQGSMYVSLIDVTNNIVKVKSTDDSDSRDFILIKMVSGG
ncbi:MAG: hypothetical protein GQ574_04580 [Crocinitomix sp.]|nr:hypothetical protein [Crocinitomix sp.]